MNAIDAPAGDLRPVPTHLASMSSDVAHALTGTPGPRRKRYTTHYETLELTANNPVKPLFPSDGNRVIAWVQALDNDVVIGPTNGVVGAGVNTAQSPATATMPNGTLIPAANGAPYPVMDNGPVWVGATNIGATASSRVTITIVTEVTDG